MCKKSTIEKLVHRHQKKLNKALRKANHKVQVPKELKYFCPCCIKQMKKGL